MSRDDWYRSESWDDAARALFETKLARARGGFYRAQYLRIQGQTLVETRQRTRVDAGRELLHRVIEEYPHEEMEVAGAHYALGQSLFREGRYGDAIEHLLACLQLEAGANFKHRTELLLAETLVECGAKASYDEAWQLLNTSAEEAVFGSEFWRIEVARARLLARTGDLTRASAHARNALELLENDTPTFSRHPTVGLIDADKPTIREMRRLARI